jgi:hypothetical protein
LRVKVVTGNFETGCTQVFRVSTAHDAQADLTYRERALCGRALVFVRFHRLSTASFL